MSTPARSPKRPSGPARLFTTCRSHPCSRTTRAPAPSCMLRRACWRPWPLTTPYTLYGTSPPALGASTKTPRAPRRSQGKSTTTQCRRKCSESTRRPPRLHPASPCTRTFCLTPTFTSHLMPLTLCPPWRCRCRPPSPNPASSSQTRPAGATGRSLLPTRRPTADPQPTLTSLLPPPAGVPASCSLRRGAWTQSPRRRRRRRRRPCHRCSHRSPCPAISARLPGQGRWLQS
jgi:hypothetical protein